MLLPDEINIGIGAIPRSGRFLKCECKDWAPSALSAEGMERDDTQLPIAQALGYRDFRAHRAFRCLARGGYAEAQLQIHQVR